MPQERSPEHILIPNPSGFSKLPEKPEIESRWNQPSNEIPLLPEATPPPPYPSIIEFGNITDEHIAFAIQDLLSYIGGMRQRAEQRANRSRAYASNTFQRISKSY